MALISRGMADKNWVLIHRLVMLAFVGPCPEGQEVCHEDGNPANPKLDNLRYDTRAGNMADKIRHGTHIYGERHPFTRVKESLLPEIKAASGTIDDISAAFGISRTHAWNIRNGKRRANG